MEAHTDLHTVFVEFSPKDPKEMDNREFAKLCKDCKLLNKKITTTDVDITFAKVKTKGARKINYNQFIEAQNCLADKEKIPHADYHHKVLGSGGPKFKGTTADDVKWHDDKTLYTGVYAKGGPTNVDTGAGGNIGDLSQLANRGHANVRGTLD